MSKIEVDTIEPQSGTSLTLGASGDTITIPSGATLDGSSATLTGIGTATVNGITMADQWRLTANITNTNGDITSNLERVDSTGFGYLGTGMTESSGIFSFPSTGIYLINAVGMFDGSNDGVSLIIRATTNNSTYSNVSFAYWTSDGQTGNNGASVFCSYLIDVTDTSNVKVKFNRDSLSSSTLYGNTSINYTHFTFIRLGDT